VNRIGLFGGSFNPVHNGHLLIARAALEELALDRLVFIPAARSPFKPGQPLAPDASRLRWLRLALAGWTRCEVDPLEIERGGISYTIETVRRLRERHPGACLHWLLGADHLPTLPRWREAEELARLVGFAVVSRPGEAPAPPLPPFRLHHLGGVPTAISSSAVRERLRRGLPVDLLLPPPVSEAVVNSGLYL